VSDQLYAVNLQAGLSFGVTNELKGFLAQTGIATETRRKKNVPSTENNGDARVEASATAKKDGETRKETGSSRKPRCHEKDEQSWVDKMILCDPVAAHLWDVHRWDFNLFELQQKTNNHPVVVMVLHMVRILNLEDNLPISMPSLVKYVAALEAGYKDASDVPFHNCCHAADVVHGTNYFLQLPQVRQHFSALDVYCLILGAAMHDFGHPGFSNAFFVNSKHDYAILYNDTSVLEMFHVSSAWRLMLTEGQDPFDGFTQEQCNDARQTIVTCVLGTGTLA